MSPDTVAGTLAATLAEKLAVFFASIQLDAASLSGLSRAECEETARTAARKALDAKLESLDAVREGLGFESARYLMLLQTDNLWKGHMKAMSFVKDFAGLKVYNQEDPLDVYREEGLELFQSMDKSLRQNSVYSFFAYQPRQ